MIAELYGWAFGVRSPDRYYSGKMIKTEKPDTSKMLYLGHNGTIVAGNTAYQVRVWMDNNKYLYAYCEICKRWWKSTAPLPYPIKLNDKLKNNDDTSPAPSPTIPVKIPKSRTIEKMQKTESETKKNYLYMIAIIIAAVVVLWVIVSR